MTDIYLNISSRWSLGRISVSKVSKKIDDSGGSKH